MVHSGTRLGWAESRPAGRLDRVKLLLPTVLGPAVVAALVLLAPAADVTRPADPGTAWLGGSVRQGPKTAVPVRQPPPPGRRPATGRPSATGRATATGGPAATATATASTRWGWPLSPRPRVLRGFQPPARRWLPGHRGVDLQGRAGQEVLVAGDGVIGFSGVIAGVGVITVLHAHGLRTTYQPVVARLPPGAAVRRGAVIARLAAAPTHCPPQACLHWALVQSAAYLDPLSLLGFGYPVLLPLGR